jgi:hypothetical protein
LLKDLSYAPFNKVEYVEDPNGALKMWYNLFNEILNKHAPIVTKRAKRDKQHEWYNTEVEYYVGVFGFLYVIIEFFFSFV